jgi:hypothetical protein
MRLRLTVLSKSSLIGSIDFKIQQLLDATSEDQLLKRVSGHLSNKKEETGKMKLSFRMEALKNLPKQQQNNNNLPSSQPSSQPPSRIQSAGGNPNSRSSPHLMMNNNNNNASMSFSNYDPSSFLTPQNNNKNSNNERFPPQNHNNILSKSTNNLPLLSQEQQRSAFPLTMTIYEIRVIELNFLNPQQQQPIILRMHCDSFYQSVEVIKNTLSNFALFNYCLSN